MTDRVRIAEEYGRRRTTQSYGTAASIEGVQRIDLPLFSDEGGDFCEIGRFLANGAIEGLVDYQPAQISYSYMEPGTIKAWHLHERQDDLWFVSPHDRLLVGLLDVREGSVTQGVQQRLTLGAGKARLLRIPRGVAHGAANVSGRPASIIYFTDNAFDPDQPDEHRLPYDLLGEDFWRIIPG